MVLNSGGANACTGPPGFADTHATAEHAARLLDVGAGDVAVCSTGLIGVRLPLGPLLAGVDKAVADLSPSGGPAAADAIRTTDTVAQAGQPLRARGHRRWHGQGRRDAGAEPGDHACVVTTDAVVDAAVADSVLRDAVRTTFERVDSDGCLSTNDTVLLLASGASGVRPSPASWPSWSPRCAPTWPRS